MKRERGTQHGAVLHRTSFPSKRIGFYSSVGGAAFTRATLDGWRDAGWEVEEIAALDIGKYRNARGRLAGIRRRWAMYGGYLIAVWKHLRAHGSGETIRVVTTNPFFLPAFVHWLAPRGRIVVLVYDVFPDVLFQAGIVRPHSFVARLLATLTRYVFERCDAAVFLGDTIKRRTEDQYGAARSSIVIPVGADGSDFHDAAPAKLPPDEVVNILYAGTLGHMHDSVTLIGFWAGPPEGRVAWRFHSSGTGYESLRERTLEVCKFHRVEFNTPLSETDWRAKMRESHVALVTLRAGAEDLVMPSKTYSALMAGQAILAICARDSDLATLVESIGCGWTVEPGDISGLRQTLNEITANPDELWRRRMNAYRAGHARFDARRLGSEWHALFSSFVS